MRIILCFIFLLCLSAQNIRAESLVYHGQVLVSEDGAIPADMTLNKIKNITLHELSWKDKDMAQFLAQYGTGNTRAARAERLAFLKHHKHLNGVVGSEGTSSLIRSFTNIVQGAKHNVCLAPTGIYQRLEKALIAHVPKGTPHHDMGQESPQPDYFIAKHNQADFMVSAPAHDIERVTGHGKGQNALQREERKNGNLPLLSSLQNAKKYLEKGHQLKGVFIPIPEGRRGVLGVRRKHWILLYITIRQGDTPVAYLIDSKGVSSKAYSVTHIEKDVKKVFGENVNWSTHYMAHQGLLNNIDCGYFVLSYIPRLMEGQTVDHLFQQHITA